MGLIKPVRSSTSLLELSKREKEACSRACLALGWREGSAARQAARLRVWLAACTPEQG